MTTTYKSSTSTLSEASSFKIYFKHNQSILEVKLSDNKLRVDEVIMQAIEIL